MKRMTFLLTVLFLMTGLISAVLAEQTVTANEVDLGFKGVGINMGYLMFANNYLGTVGFGGEVDFGSLVKPDGEKNKVINVRLRAEVEYWKTHRDLDKKTDDASDDEVLSDFSITAGPKLRFQIPDAQFNPYIYAHLGLHFVTDKKIRETSNSTPFQFRVGAGTEWLLTPQFVPFAHIRLNVGDTNSFGIMGGCIYRF